MKLTIALTSILLLAGLAWRSVSSAMAGTDELPLTSVERAELLRQGMSYETVMTTLASKPDSALLTATGLEEFPYVAHLFADEGLDGYQLTMYFDYGKSLISCRIKHTRLAAEDFRMVVT